MFFELLKEEYYEKNLAYFQKTPKDLKKDRLLYAILVGIVGAMFWYIMQDYIYLLAIPIGLFIGYKLPYYSVLSKKEQADKQNRHLFPEFMGSFIALIPTTGNVYQTLRTTIPYTKEPLRAGLEELVEKIRLDNNREHYMAFADFVGTNEASLVMDTIYQFSEFGVKKDSLKELEQFVFELEKNAQNELLEKKMGDMEYLGYLPIFLSMVFILAFVGVMLVEFFSPVMNTLS